MTATTAESDRSFGYAAVAAVLVGLLVVGFGLLFVPASVLGGAWIAAVGLSLALAGLFETGWAGRRFDLSDGDRRTLSVAFLALTVVLTVAFLVINVFGGVTVTETTS